MKAPNLLAVSVLCGIHFALAQGGENAQVSWRSTNDPLAMSGIAITDLPGNVSFDEACSLLRTRFGQPICYEYFADSETNRVRLWVAKNMTLRDILKDLCDQMGDRFGYRIEQSASGSIVLDPRNRIRSQKFYPMERNIPKFDVTNYPISKLIGKLIDMHIISSTTFNGSGNCMDYVILQDTPTKRISLNLSNVTLRDLLCEAVAQVSNTAWEVMIDGTNCYVMLEWIKPVHREPSKDWHLTTDPINPATGAGAQEGTIFHP